MRLLQTNLLVSLLAATAVPDARTLDGTADIGAKTAKPLPRTDTFTARRKAEKLKRLGRRR